MALLLSAGHRVPIEAFGGAAPDNNHPSDSNRPPTAPIRRQGCHGAPERKTGGHYCVCMSFLRAVTALTIVEVSTPVPHRAAICPVTCASAALITLRRL